MTSLTKTLAFLSTMSSTFYTVLFFLLFFVAIIAVGKLIKYLIEDNEDYYTRRRPGTRKTKG